MLNTESNTKPLNQLRAEADAANMAVAVAEARADVQRVERGKAVESVLLQLKKAANSAREKAEKRHAKKAENLQAEQKAELAEIAAEYEKLAADAQRDLTGETLPVSEKSAVPAQPAGNGSDPINAAIAGGQ